MEKRSAAGRIYLTDIFRLVFLAVLAIECWAHGFDLLFTAFPRAMVLFGCAGVCGLLFAKSTWDIVSRNGARIESQSNSHPPKTLQ